MKIRLIPIILIIALLLTACGDDDSGTPPGVITTNDNGGFMQNISASYTVNLTTLFSEEMFPEEYPSNASFGTIVAIIHSPELTIFENGELASEGMSTYAETGDTQGLASFISTELGAENEGQFVIQTEGSIDPTATTTFDINFTPTRTNVTILAKLNPSPDWFIGLSSFSIVDGNELIEEADFNLILLDAGSKAGMTYSSSDIDENAVIAGSNDAPFSNNDPFLPQIATLSISRN